METKTERSQCKAPLAPFAVDAPHQQRENQVTQRLLKGPDWHNDMGLVFTTDDGRPFSGSWVTRHFQSVLATAGLPRRRFHELRHGFASLLLAQGVDLKVILDLLGHSKLHTTATIYTHVMPALQVDAARRLDALLG